jgi:nitroreductase
MTTRRQVNLALLSGAVLSAAPPLVLAQPTEALELPPPRNDRGGTLMQALRGRRSTREYAERVIPPQILSDLLWAAFGVNRPASGDRTAPSWRHSIEIEIFVSTADGVWRYEPGKHRLVLHLDADIRGQTGTQDFVATVPLNVVYVADSARMGNASKEDQRLYAFTDTGFIGQNVYLFCASEGLACVFRASVDRERLARSLRIRNSQFVTCAQSIGYPRV